MRIYIYFTFLALSIWTCVEPFEPEVGTYDSTLVVDGIFNDGEEPSRIFLSSSFAYSENENIPIQGAQVVIEEEQGGRTILVESTPGVYQTDPSTFKGEVGKSYRLLVNTPDGNAFESSWEQMKASPAIEDLHYAIEERAPDDPNLQPVPGAQIYLSTKDTENNTRYYRWEFEETYQYSLPHPPAIRATFGDPPGRGNDEVQYIPLSEWEGAVCWKTEYSQQILIATTENLSQDFVKDFPVYFVSNKTTRLSKRYSMLIKQYAISQSYYKYLEKVEAINETTGSLFDPIPNELFGNIRSVNGKEIPVLGYFGVAGIAATRIFINREDLPVDLRMPYQPLCLNDTIPLSFSRLYSETKFRHRALYDYNYNLVGTPIAYLLTDPICASCAANNATNVKPDFW